MTEEVKITPENYDVTQVVEVPAGVAVKVDGRGQGRGRGAGSAALQPARGRRATESVFDIKVDYDTDQVAVNDLVDVDVTVTFNPPEPIKAGMMVLDVSVPTGFAAVEESLAGPARATRTSSATTWPAAR